MNGTTNTAQDPEVQELLGDSCMKLGQYQRAFDAYVSAESHRKIIELGNSIIQENRQLAFQCFMHANASERIIEIARDSLDNPYDALRVLEELEQAPSDVLIGIADSLKERGHLLKCKELYIEAQHTEALEAVGALFLREPIGLYQAKECYRLAGKTIPAHELIQYAHMSLDQGEVNQAIQALTLISDKKHLYKIAVRYLERGDYAIAQNLFDDLPNEMPTESLVKCADVFLKTGDVSGAVELYEQTGHPIDYTAIGDAYNGKKQTQSAIEAYKKANDANALLALGKKLLAKGVLLDAHDAYTAASAEIPRAQVIELGTKRLRSGWLEGGIQAFELVGEEASHSDINECGAVLLEKGRYEAAKKAYAITGMPIPTDLLVSCASICLQKHNITLVHKLYQETGQSIEPALYDFLDQNKAIPPSVYDEVIHLLVSLGEYEAVEQIITNFLEAERLTQAFDALKQLGQYASMQLCTTVAERLLQSHRAADFTRAQEAFAIALQQPLQDS